MDSNQAALDNLSNRIAALEKLLERVQTKSPSLSSTWTPVLGTESGASGQTYTVQAGRYIKEGRKVTAFFDTTLSVLGTLPGTYAAISGLPFAADTSLNDVGFLVVGQAQSFASNLEALGGYVGSGNGFCYLTGAASPSTSPYATLAKSVLAATTVLRGVIIYLAAS